MPPAEQQQIRDLLRKYTTAVEGPEWEQQDTGGTSDGARAALTQMYRVVSRQDPDAASAPVNGEFMGQLTVLASQRNSRVLDAEPRIPWILWFGVIFGGLVLIGLMGFMRLESYRGHAVLSSAVAVLLGLLLFIVFCLDHPFGTETGVTSAPSNTRWRCSTRSTRGSSVAARTAAAHHHPPHHTPRSQGQPGWRRRCNSPTGCERRG